MLLSIPACIYAYFDVNARYEDGSWEYPHEYLYYLCGVVCIMTMGAILSVNAVSFINSGRVRKVRFRFKEELSACIRTQIPEITHYQSDRKIHPRYFAQSGMFTTNYSDYLGDDLFSGEYKDCRFDICELHVFSLFKAVFDGLFVHIFTPKGKDFHTPMVQMIEVYRNRLPDGLNIQGHAAFNGDIYMAFHHKSTFFEENKIKEIKVLDQDVLILTEMIQCIKQVIELGQNPVDEQLTQDAFSVQGNTGQTSQH